MRNTRWRCVLGAAALAVAATAGANCAPAQQPPAAEAAGLAPEDAALRPQALAALKKAATYYRTQVASHGGYVYFYSADLKLRWGEGQADAETAFVQPPGTPTVGDAYLSAYRATGDSYYLDAATETAGALVAGQLQSGGWMQTIHFGPAKRNGKYRTRAGGDWNQSSLDDNQTQSALAFLLELNAELKSQNASIRDAASYGLKGLLAAQFANGAFPQVFAGPASEQPIVKAKYPAHDWKTEGRLKNYWDHYTLNDGLAGSVSDTLITAAKLAPTDDEKQQAESALRKLGGFLLSAQMPAPQPAWCQQYNYAMEPIWARKFEPPAITGSESQDVLRTLIKLAKHTGDLTYLEPIPRALAYLKTCRLPDGRLPRFLELKSNKPLYMTREYQLTYDDSATPDHYGWKAPAKLDEIEREAESARLEIVAAKQAEERKANPNRPQEFEGLVAGIATNLRNVRSGPSAEGRAEVRKVIDALDDQGRWLSTFDGEALTGQPKFAKGFQYVSSAVFAKRVATLTWYLNRTRE